MDDQTKQGDARPDERARVQEPGAAALGRGGRMSRQRKAAAVLRLLRGEDLEMVSRSLGVTAATPLKLARSISGCRRGGAEYETRHRRGAGERAAEGQARGSADRA
jgi:hypothetical protein